MRRMIQYWNISKKRKSSIVCVMDFIDLEEVRNFFETH